MAAGWGFTAPTSLAIAPFPADGTLAFPPPKDCDGRLAQLVEQLTLNQRVVGSNPTAPTNDFNDLLRNVGLPG